MFRIEDEIELCVGIKTLEFVVPPERRKAVYGRTQVAILKGLGNRDAVADDRKRKG